MIERFVEFLKYEKQYSLHTVNAYQKDLLFFESFCRSRYNHLNIVHIDYQYVRDWIVFLAEKGISNSTINRKVSSLKSFYKFLQKIEEIDVDPLLKHRALKVKKKIQIPFSKLETSSLSLDAELDDGFVSLRNKLIVGMLYSTGMRRAELIGLKESSVDFELKTILVLGKRNKQRILPLLPSVEQTLLKYLQLKRSLGFLSDVLLVTEKGKKIYETLVYRIVNAYFSEVSTKQKKSPHILRHTFATHLLNQGADLNSVKELLGHSSLASTQIYTHNSLEQLKIKFNQAHPRSEKKD